MIALMVTGLVLGLSAGFSPGPLSILLISQTLKYGTREGIKVSFAPLFSDMPIIVLTMVVLTQIAGSQTFLGGLSIVGGMFLLYLAYESFRTGGIELGQMDAPQSLTKGVVVNLLNPNPYVFWLTVGAPTVVKAWAETPFAAVAFVASFYSCLVGSKFLLAVLVGKSRNWFMGKPYVYLMRGLGVLLVGVAGMMLREGVQMLGGLR